MEDNLKQNTLIITDEIKSFLKETSKWSKIMAIIGFVGLGLMVLIGVLSWLFFGVVTSGNSGMSGISGGFGGIMAFIYIILAIFYYFPIIYLYRFSTNIKTAIDSDDQNQLAIAFENLKKHYKFIGILAITIIIIYIVIFIVSLIVGAGSLI